MRFHELHAGLVIEAGPATVDEAEILDFARTFDPQWFHTDVDAADDGPYQGLIASGWHTCAIAMRLAADAVLAGSEAVASPGVASIKWRNPVRPGDALRLYAEILETRRSASRPQRGILRWRWRLVNQHGQEVLDLEATSFFDLAADGST